MKILFDNLVKTATLTTTYPNLNYPVTNLAHTFLRRRYQMASSPTTITVTLAAASSVNCFFYGYHNLTAITVRLYNAGDALLKTVTIASPESGVGAEHFDTIALVTYAEIDISAAATGYLGGVGLGLTSELPRPIADFKEELVDNSIVSMSPEGQTQQIYVEPLGSDIYTIRDVTRDERAAIIALFLAVGIGAPLWIDAFYGNHSYKAPYYGHFVQTLNTKKNGRRFDFGIELRESR